MPRKRRFRSAEVTLPERFRHERSEALRERARLGLKGMNGHRESH